MCLYQPDHGGCSQGGKEINIEFSDLLLFNRVTVYQRISPSTSATPNFAENCPKMWRRPLIVRLVHSTATGGSILIRLDLFGGQYQGEQVFFSGWHCHPSAMEMAKCSRTDAHVQRHRYTNNNLKKKKKTLEKRWISDGTNGSILIVSSSVIKKPMASCALSSLLLNLQLHLQLSPFLSRPFLFISFCSIFFIVSYQQKNRLF